MDKRELLKHEARIKLDRLAAIRDMATNRITPEIRTEMTRLVTELEQINRDLADDKRAQCIDDAFALQTTGREPVAKSLPLDDPMDKRAVTVRPSTLNDATRHRSGYRTPGEEKSYRSLFGPVQNDWQWSDQSFFQALVSGRAHPGLAERRGMVEGTPSSGGFLVPQEESETIFDIAMQNEIVLPRSHVVPMTTATRQIPAFEIGDHSASLWGGFSASFTAETGSMTPSQPAIRQMTLSAKKLTGYCRISNELYADMGMRSGELLSLLGRGLAWYRDKFLIGGDGSGEPQGVRHAPCKIVVPAEGGQAPDTIVYENIVNMLSRIHPASVSRSVWLVNPSCLKQLLTLSLTIGTSGSAIPVLTSEAGTYKMLNLPVILTEHLPVLGDEDDIMLVDFSQYVVGLRSDISVDLSQHLYFSSDELAVRVICRFDGQSLWPSSLTLADGLTVVSPVVSLAAR